MQCRTERHASKKHAVDICRSAATIKSTLQRRRLFWIQCHSVSHVQISTSFTFPLVAKMPDSFPPPHRHSATRKGAHIRVCLSQCMLRSRQPELHCTLACVCVCVWRMQLNRLAQRPTAAGRAAPADCSPHLRTCFVACLWTIVRCHRTLTPKATSEAMEWSRLPREAMARKT